MWPYAATCLESAPDICPHAATDVSSFYHICVLILDICVLMHHISSVRISFEILLEVLHMFGAGLGEGRGAIAPHVHEAFSY